MIRSFASSVQQSRVTLSRVLGSSNRALSSTTVVPAIFEHHREFLHRVKDYGDGEILLNRIGPNQRILEIVIKNPKKKNAISGVMCYQLAHIVEEVHRLIIQSDDAVDEEATPPPTGAAAGIITAQASNNLVGLVIRGDGIDCFSSGVDLQFAGELVNSGIRGKDMASFMTEALNSLRQCGLISLCCINGTAVGGGSELTTVTDFRLMTGQEKKFIQFVHATLGASPGLGGAVRLAHIVGRQKAIELACSAQKIPAQHALELGLINGIIDPNLIKTGEDWYPIIDKFFQPYLDAKLFSGSIRGIKQTIAGCEYLTKEESEQLELDVFRHRWFNKDHKSVMDKILSAKK